MLHSIPFLAGGAVLLMWASGLVPVPAPVGAVIAMAAAIVVVREIVREAIFDVHTVRAEEEVRALREARLSPLKDRATAN